MSYFPKKVWSPTDTTNTNIDIFRRCINAKRGLRLRNSRELHAWSVNPSTAADWWSDLFEFEQLKPEAVPVQSMKMKATTMFPSPEFFPDIRMNFSEHIFQHKNPLDIAMYACSEGGGDLRSYTWDQVWKDVERVADALVAAGIQIGDRVAAVISHCPEAIITCLAVLSIGAIWSTSSPDMGAKGIMDRLLQIKPKIVFFETSVLYNNKNRDLVPKYIECVDQLRTVLGFCFAVFIRRKMPLGVEKTNIYTWEQFLATGTGRKLVFEQLAFNHPGFVVYSSGTTGRPKCIVHSACGLLLQVKKDYMLSLDVRPGDTIFQYTTTGWIMWTMVLCGLSYGGSVLVYDGSPFQPDPLVTFRLAEQLKISLYGTSARFLSDLKAMKIRPRDECNLSHLRTITSTGSVLTAEVCQWAYDDAFPPHIHLASGSGGTDMACALVGGDPTAPVYAGEIQGPSLGMAVDVFDSTASIGKSIADAGSSGELVCTQPFPSQPVNFWGPNGASTYRSSYFERFGDSIWNQGDTVAVSPITGGFIMLGRSDGVLNPSGIRFGSAEIYNALQDFAEFEDTICVGQRRATDIDETVLLFVKMAVQDPPRKLTADLVTRVRNAIRKALSPRHIPSHIFEVPAIPYTINGKKIEVAVKKIVSGQMVEPSGAVANPESLKFYERFVNLKDLKDKQKCHKLTKL